MGWISRIFFSFHVEIGDSCQEVDECQSNPCKNGATCIDDLDGYKCQCRNGYTGLDCEVAIDYCANVSPTKRCRNGGTCRNIPETASTVCDCPAGFTGLYCQDDVDECASGPCQNGAQCVNFVSAKRNVTSWPNA